MRREIDAPDQEWLTKRQAFTWLGISLKAFDHLVSKGIIPPPRVVNQKAKYWHWSWIVAASILLQAAGDK